jgi:hypothetical protein
VRDVSADEIESAFHVRLVPSVDTSEIRIDREYLVVIDAKYRTKRAIVKIVVRKRYKATIGQTGDLVVFLLYTAWTFAVVSQNLP